MERIKDAIEKAKTQREQSDGAARASAVRLTAVKPQNTGDRGPTSELDTQVQYRQTPVIQLDPEHLSSQRIVAHEKMHPVSWAFDLLRTQVLQKMDENGWRTLAVTSPTMESGKTVVAINLAIGIAQQTNRTSLLIDFDLRRPRVASSLGLQRDVSLNQVLAGNARIEDAMVNPGIPRFVVLPTQRPIPSSAEVLGSSRVAALMSELREHYSDRVVVVDLPPVLAADDVLAVLPRVDCVLMVVGNGVSTKKEIEESMSRLSKFNLLGVVLNKDEAPVNNAYY
ncbi:CpsD/CapB family tyrosine-protein kinase [Hydrogenophaga laconesensis]|uniref:Capsular exopolysaccharide synthesis family protein n=1 Tax=Hydrogenophaga laconesensis TaxID=1805971 RepID=A0ABU1V4M2_9BURK|nr:CpsD/CapB family tyrosine-protein kinase [Hydrogenophaga laconesensis]MDR7092345.1 capsular exopolysaccharide synthesis family protein [Hydrogenophaga laconesensis]